MSQLESRKVFFKRCTQLLTSVFAISIITESCNSNEKKPVNNTGNGAGQCDDLSGLSENDVLTRKKFNYVDVAPVKSKTCKLCNLHIPPKPNETCGGCMLFKGPVRDEGTCTYWVAKVENSDS